MNTAFFVVSKVGWALLRPETWVVLSVTVSFAMLVFGRRKAARWCLGFTTLGLLAITILPLGSLFLRPLETAYPANPSLENVAGIIVLGGGEDTLQTALWGLPQVNEGGDRFISALILAERFPAAKVLFTGGIGSVDQSGLTGADVAEALFLGVGLDQERLFLERKSRNTAENARASLALRPEQDTGSWVLITSGAHMPRAVETFCAAGWTDLVPWPTDFQSEAFVEGIGWNFAGNLAELSAALHEHLGRVVYRVTGRAVGAIPQNCLFSGGA